MEVINKIIVNKGDVEELQKIEVLEDGTVLIYYTIPDEYMKKYELIRKNRICKINPINSDLPRFESYSNINDN